MLRIGITIGLRHESESMWVNGIKQTAIFFAKLLMSSPRRHRVTLVNTTPVRITRNLPWDLLAYPTLQFEHAKDALDVLFVMGGAISPDWLSDLKARGVKVVSFRLGSEYFVSMERIIFNLHAAESPPLHLAGFDKMWFIPQVWEANHAYLQVLHRLRPEQLRQVPFVWDPMFVAAYAREKRLDNGGEYRPRPGPKRISCFEPNINVLKTFLYPLLIAETAFRRQPEDFEFVSILNSGHFRNNPEFLGVVGHLDLVRAPKKCFFEDRHVTPGFLALHTDVVVSHQIHNPLNNLLLEVAWQGYPLVHNSHLCSDLGYYYDGFDVEQAAQSLCHALRAHDDAWQEYRDRQRESLAQFLPTNPALISAYDALLDDLFSE